jgi:hypothetical protein
MSDNTYNDDGYGGSITGPRRLIKGEIFKCVDGRWSDRDGMEVPPVHIAIAIDEALQQFKNKKRVDQIIDKPLPDVDELNNAIPKEDWEPGFDGEPSPPWKHQYLVYLIDPETGAFSTAINSTVGMMMAWEQLRERVIVTRQLRGEAVVPVVKLANRPFKAFRGITKLRPHFEILGWKLMGGGALAAPQAPQLSGPAESPDPNPKPASDRKPDPKSRATNTSMLDALEDVAEPSLSEIMDDKVEF